MRVDVDIDEHLLEEVRRRLGNMEKMAPHAVSRAMNRALTNIASNISKEVRKDYNVKAGDVKASLEDKKRASRTDLSGYVKSTGSTLPLESFKTTPRKPNPKRKIPYKVAVKKNGGPKDVRNGFLVYLGGLPRFVRRTGVKSSPEKGTYGNKRYKTKDGYYIREKISRLSGPSVPQMLGGEEIRQEIQAKGMDMFNRTLEHEINRIIEKGRQG